MLTPFREILAERSASGVAVGAFTCYDVTTSFGVLRAAEERDVPVILLVSEASFAGLPGPGLVAALAAVAKGSSVPTCVQLDHVSDEALIARALECGIGAVMVDGSRLPFAENQALVRRVRQAASGDVGVEVELGQIEGGEDVAAAIEAGVLTDPAEAAALASGSDFDCLAVSIGNVHGHYASPPRLDWERLEAIRSSVAGLPMSLHGASGLSDEDVRHAVALGVRKVNVNTEIRARYVAELESQLPEVRRGLRVLNLCEAVTAAVAEVAGSKLDLFAGDRREEEPSNPWPPP